MASSKRHLFRSPGTRFAILVLATVIAAMARAQGAGVPTPTGRIAPEAPPPHSKYYRTAAINEITVTPAPAGLLRSTGVKVAMRDGVKLSVNIYRPNAPGAYPVILSVTRYSKDSYGPGRYQGWAKASGFEIGRMSISEYTPFEAPDPAFWVPHGYVVIHADIRGAYESEGDIGPIAPQDAQDYYDLIEWAGTQYWSNGNVGLSGVSYLAFSQWPVAALRPPHLKAIIPWEGVTDHYRDNAFHGGIPETNFRTNAYTLGLEDTRHPGSGLSENYALMLRKHPLFDDYWWPRAANLELIRVPALICATWSAQGNHSRGSFEGFKRIRSKDKWMVSHGRVEWPTYYAPESTALQLRFFDRFLKELDNGMESVPRVQYDVRQSRDEYSVHFAKDWPIPGTKYVRLFLDAANHSLVKVLPRTESTTSYESTQDEHVEFDYTFAQATTLIGNMVLHLWVSAEQADDLDLFVGIRKFDPRGDEVYFTGFGGNPNDIVTRGWLRVSARERDEQQSTPWQPYLLHSHVRKINPAETVPVDVEILPSGTSFEKGAKLRLVIQGRDVVPNPILRHDDSVNRGTHTMHTGGRFDSFLLVPDVSLQ